MKLSERNQLPPKHRRGGSLLEGADFGPSVSRKAGRLLSEGPAEVVFEDREDITYDLNSAARRPIVRGARRRDVLGDLARCNAITDRQHKAANRFLDELSRAQGGSAASFTQIVVSGGTKVGITHVQREALQDIERVTRMLGMACNTVFWWVVLQNKSPNEYDTLHRQRHGTSLVWLCQSLDSLDVHYYPPSRGRERP